MGRDRRSPGQDIVPSVFGTTLNGPSDRVLDALRQKGLPRSLWKAWEKDQVPDPLRLILHLGLKATFADAAEAIKSADRHSPWSELRRLLASRIMTNLQGIRNVRVFDRPWPSGLSFFDLGLPTRILNQVSRKGLDPPERISTITYSDLADVEGMGGLSILDLALVGESAIDAHVKRFGPATLEEREASRMPGVPAHWLQAGASRPDVDPAARDFTRLVAETGSQSWAHTVAGSDPRFADAVRWHGQPDVPLRLRRQYRVLPSHGAFREKLGIQPSRPPLNGTLGEELNEAKQFARVEDRVARQEELRSVIEACRSEVARVCGLHLEDALMDFFAAVTAWNEPRLAALRMRLGLNAVGPSSLQEAGSLLGVSRERVRQLMQTLQERLPDGPVFMPQLDAALKAFREAMPLSGDTALALLADIGIAKGPIHPEALSTVAGLCGRTIDLRTKRLPGGYAIGSRESLDLLVRIASVAWPQATASGASSVAEAVEQLAVEGVTVEPSVVRKSLRAHAGFTFLTDDWFWASAGSSNRLRDLGCKMLAVHEPQTVQCLRAGMHRAFRYRQSSAARGWPKFVPPPSILLEFFRRHPDFRLGERDLVYTTATPDLPSLLSLTEKRLLEASRDFGDEIPNRSKLMEVVKESGLNPNTVAAAIAFSAVLESSDRKSKILRGTGHATAEDFETTTSLPNPKRTIGYSWLPDRRLMIAYRLPGFTTDPSVAIPAPVLGSLRGLKFRAFSEQGHEMGVVSIHQSYGGHSRGYGQFLDRRGAFEGAMAEAGDILIAKFDLGEGTVTLSVKFLDIPDYESDD